MQSAEHALIVSALHTVLSIKALTKPQKKSLMHVKKEKKRNRYKKQYNRLND